MVSSLQRLQCQCRRALLITLLAALPFGFARAHISYASGVTVTTTADELNDDGDCSLREAIATVHTNTAVDECSISAATNTITLGAATYTLRIANQLDAKGQGIDEDANARGDLDIQKNLVIVGVGAATIIDGNQIDRVFEILPNTTVTLSNLSIRNGRSSTGGGILNNGTLTVNQSAISNNIGSGIVNQATGSAELTNTIILGNTGDYGGGINNAGTLRVTSSIIRDNLANGFDEPSGGGINNATSGTIALTTSQLINNHADYGGGIANNGSLTISNARIIENTAGFGAGIFNRGSLLNIDGTFMAGNSSAVGGAGIYTENSLTLSNSTLYDNSAGAEGGGLLYGTTETSILINNTFSSNRSGGSGGGIHNTTNGTLNLNNLTITGNTANSDEDEFGSGGGISNPFGTINIKNSIVANNVDASPQDGALDCSGTLSSQGFNLILSVAGCMIEDQAGGNILGQQPLLGPLENNDSTIPTHALQAGSPAIDAGSPADLDESVCSAADQRGTARPQDGNADGAARCDIGAFELALPPSPSPLPSPSPSPSLQPIPTRIFLPVIMEQAPLQ